MLTEIIQSLGNNSIIMILGVSIMLDIILGTLRSIKEKKINSTIGINGAIRKSAMFICIIFFMCIDCIIRINLLFMIPEQYIQILGFEELGLCEFFSIIFILHECLSILKNMILCNLPVPKIIKEKISYFLENMTKETETKI